MDNQPAVVTPDNLPPPPAPAPFVSQPTPPVTPPIKAKHAHTFIFGYITILILVAAIGGIYGWQHNKLNNADAKVANLQGQITRLNSNAGTFTYTPNYGNVSLTLPRNYSVVVNSDGCPCDKPYTGFFTLTKSSSNVLNNFGSSQYAEINILDSYDGNMSTAIAGVESNFDTKTYSIVSVTNTTVDNFPAKLITTSPKYLLYVVGTGKWLDQIGIQINNAQSYALQSAILKGIVIKK